MLNSVPTRKKKRLGIVYNRNETNMWMFTTCWDIYVRSTL